MPEAYVMYVVGMITLLCHLHGIICMPWERTMAAMIEELELLLKSSRDCGNASAISEKALLTSTLSQNIHILL